jgi:hypothetical protein
VVLPTQTALYAEIVREGQSVESVGSAPGQQSDAGVFGADPR